MPEITLDEFAKCLDKLENNMHKLTTEELDVAQFGKVLHNRPAKEFWYPTAFSHWGDEEYTAIQRVIDSKQFTMGPEVAAFEREFAIYHGMKYGVMVNSGSSANLIIVATLAQLDLIGRDDVAIVPALAWSTTYAPLIQYGLQLRLADCDDTWNSTAYDMQQISGDVVVGCSILGNPAELAEMENNCVQDDAIFIEDNCESLGATSYGGLCGTYGFMNSFSFFYSHQISAIEGGMILTNDEGCYQTCRMLRAHGWTRDDGQPKEFETEYDFQSFGYNVRPTEIHAAVAREQLKKLPVFNANRRANLNYFKSYFANTGWNIVPQRVEHGHPAPFGLAFTVPRGTRPKLVQALRARGIDCRLPTGGSFRLHQYGKNYKDQQTPNADAIHQCGLFLGNAPFLIQDKIDEAVKVIKGIL